MRNLAPWLLAFLLIALWLRIDFFFTIIYFLGLIYFGSRWWMRRALRNLRVERTFADHAFWGERVPIDVAVRNTGRLPVPWMEVRESLPSRLTAVPLEPEVILLRGGQRWTARYWLLCRSRGYYELGPLRLEAGDLLGVGQVSELTAAEPRRLTVYPRLLPLDQLGLPTRSPMAILPARAPLFEDATRLRGVRPYQRGDAPRRIHWPATAHARQLLVKQYAPAIARETILCLDLVEDDYELGRRYMATELAISIAASLAAHIILREHLPVGLVTEAVDPVVGKAREIVMPPRAERAHLVGNLLDVLARVETLPTGSFTALLRRTAVHFPWGASVVVITGTESPALLEMLLYLQRQGLAVALVLAEPGGADRTVRPRGAALSIYHVARDDALEIA